MADRYKRGADTDGSRTFYNTQRPRWWSRSSPETKWLGSILVNQTQDREKTTPLRFYIVRRSMTHGCTLTRRRVIDYVRCASCFCS